MCSLTTTVPASLSKSLCLLSVTPIAMSAAGSASNPKYGIMKNIAGIFLIKASNGPISVPSSFRTCIPSALFPTVWPFQRYSSAGSYPMYTISPNSIPSPIISPDSVGLIVSIAHPIATSSSPITSADRDETMLSSICAPILSPTTFVSFLSGGWS